MKALSKRGQFLLLAILCFAGAAFSLIIVPKWFGPNHIDDLIIALSLVFASLVATMFFSMARSTEEANATEHAMEAELVAAGANAPRLNPTHIDAMIVSEQYYIFPTTTLTICCLKLRNGFQVIGESACASPENFNEELGRKYARVDAREKIWRLEGYLLCEKLAGRAGYDAHRARNAA